MYQIDSFLKKIARKIIRYFINTLIGFDFAGKKWPIALLNTFFKIVRWLGYRQFNFYALPLIWMDESKLREKILIEGGTGIAHGSHHIGQDKIIETINLPDVSLYRFEHARVSVNSSSVILNDQQVLIERALGPDQDRYNFSSGHIVAHGKASAVVQLGDGEYVENGIFLGGNGASNYYHWMIEILAKLEFLPMLPEYAQSYPLLISEDVERIPSFKDALDIFNKKYKVIVLKPNVSYQLGELFYINSPNNQPFNLNKNVPVKYSYTTINPNSIRFIRNTILEKALSDVVSSKYHKRIFFCRKMGLRNYNQDEVFSILLNLGFSKVFMEDFDFIEQVRMVYNADMIVGPSGAAWANLVFCRKNTKCLCWDSEEAKQFSAFSTIAGINKVNLRYLSYKAGVKSTAELYSKDYYIDPERIKNAILCMEDE